MENGTRQNVREHGIRATRYAHEREERESGLCGTLAGNNLTKYRTGAHGYKHGIQWQTFLGAVREYLGSLTTKGQSIKHAG